jgi:hypothetical protein
VEAEGRKEPTADDVQQITIGVVELLDALPNDARGRAGKRAILAGLLCELSRREGMSLAEVLMKVEWTWGVHDDFAEVFLGKPVAN